MKGMYDADTVRSWIAGAEAEVSELTLKSEDIQFQLAEARRRLMLLYEVLASVTNAPVPVSADELGIGRSARERVQADAESILLISVLIPKLALPWEPSVAGFSDQRGDQ